MDAASCCAVFIITGLKMGQPIGPSMGLEMGVQQ